MNNLYPTALAILFCLTAGAQSVTTSPKHHSPSAKHHYFADRPTAARSLMSNISTGHSGTGANIDIKYHRFNWRIDPDAPRSIQGTVTTYFQTIENNVNTISFDLNKASFNNAGLSVTYHGSATGVSYSFPAAGYTDILTVTLPVTLSSGALDSVNITYSGTPPAPGASFSGFIKSSFAGGNYIYTLSESYEDKDWWPCKADMQDKIDSVDFIITTPSAFTAITNGKLISNILSGADRVYTFKHRYPIASYLVSIAVGKYNFFDRGTVNIGGIDVPVRYYILSGHGVNPTTQLNAMDLCKQELVLYSNLFGDYPFKNENYGMYEFGFGGGMEHQTISGMGFNAMTDAPTVTHELAHQWFGDKVTPGTWNDLWLAEGFATYCEIITAENIPIGITAATLINFNKTDANSATYRNFSCYIPNSSIGNSDQIWSGGYGYSVYARGSMVVSMLRILLGDTKFFQACRNYINEPALAYRSATTDDLKNHMQAAAGGFDLTGFFNDFVYGSGYPTTTVNWSNPSGNILNISVGSQTRTAAPATAYFHNVISLRVQGASAGEDTTIIIYDADGNNLAKAGTGTITLVPGNLLNYTLSFKPVTVTFDPFSTSLSAGNTVKVAPDYPPRVLAFTVVENGAANDGLLTLDGLSSDVTLERAPDGLSFITIGTMPLQSSTTGNAKYFLKDIAPLTELNYYRAKYKNAGGEYKYTAVIKLGEEENRAESFAIKNSPVHGTVQLINAVKATGKNYSFCMYDASGKLISRTQKNVQGNVTELNLLPFSHGVYVLKIISPENDVQTIKFLAD